MWAKDRYVNIAIYLLDHVDDMMTKSIRLAMTQMLQLAIIIVVSVIKHQY